MRCFGAGECFRLATTCRKLGRGGATADYYDSRRAVVSPRDVAAYGAQHRVTPSTMPVRAATRRMAEVLTDRRILPITPLAGRLREPRS